MDTSNNSLKYIGNENTIEKIPEENMRKHCSGLLWVKYESALLPGIDAIVFVANGQLKRGQMFVNQASASKNRHSQ